MQANMECRNAVRRIFIMGYRKGTPEYKRLKGLKEQIRLDGNGAGCGETFPVAPLQMTVQCNREIPEW